MDEFEFVGSSDEEGESSATTATTKSSKIKSSSTKTSPSSRSSVSRSSKTSRNVASPVRGTSTILSSLSPSSSAPSSPTSTTTATGSAKSSLRGSQSLAAATTSESRTTIQPSWRPSQTTDDATSTTSSPSRGRTKAQRRLLRQARGELSEDDEEEGQAQKKASQSTTGAGASSRTSSLPLEEASRKVRFSLQEDDAASSSQVSRQSSANPAFQVLPPVRSPRSRFRTQRRRQRPVSSSNWLQDVEQGESGLATTTGRNGGSKADHLGPSSQPRETSAGPVTAGMVDVFSFSDTGSTQFILDECCFLCSTLQHTCSTKSSSTGARTISTLLQTAVDLAKLLSDKKRRKVLLHDATCLQSILDVLGCTQRFLDMTSSSSSKGPGAVTSMSPPTTPPPKSRGGRLTQGLEKIDRDDTDEGDHSLVQAIALAMHFLSLDCTLSEEASTLPVGARRVRQAILQHSKALQGIMHLVLSDPVVQHILPRENDDPKSVHDDETAIVFGNLPAPAAETVGGSQESFLTASSNNSSVLGTPDSQASASSSGSSVDPTIAGRRRKRRRAAIALPTIEEAPGGEGAAKRRKRTRSTCTKDDSLSFCSEKESPAENTLGDSLFVAKARDQMESLVSRHIGPSIATLEGTTSLRQEHDCGLEEPGKMSALVVVAVLSLQRIISGKMEGSEKSCLEEEEASPAGPDLDDVTDEIESNPLFVTNRFLGESGVVELLAQALAETLAAVGHLLTKKSECQGCLSLLHDRVVSLGSLVDNASLLHDANRQLFCESGYTAEFQGFLIVGLVSLLRTLMEEGKRWDGILGEMALASLRTLTSLTHENPVAANELTVPLGRNQCGLDVVAHAFWQATHSQSAENKVPYDALVFCLNTLTNAVESQCPRRHFAKLVTPDGNSMMMWLSEWLVEQTASFRQAVLETTFGLEGKHADRELAPQEDENLVVAGSGFVLVACLLIDGDAKDSIRGDLLQHLPGERFDSKLVFVVNTLKAYCNFYHHTVGELSVAVVAPVKTLIEKLETLSE